MGSRGGPKVFSHYRDSALGLSLRESLQELVENGEMDPQTAVKVLAQFDRSVTELLVAKSKHSAVISGKLHTYRNLDTQWLFTVKDARVQVAEDVLRLDMLKIVACDSIDRTSQQKNKK